MRALLIDLDGTLLDGRAAVREAFSAFLAAHDLPLGCMTELFSSWASVSNRHWLRYEAGELTFLEQRRCRVRDFLARDLTDDEADAAFAVYDRVYTQSWRLFPDVAAFLARTKHVPKVIVTNGDRQQQLLKIERTGLAAHLTGVVTPDDCGYWKPSARIFLTAAEALDVRPEHCAMIGDDMARDIEPAERLGMRCFHVDRSGAGRDLSGFAP